MALIAQHAIWLKIRIFISKSTSTSSFFFVFRQFSSDMFNKPMKLSLQIISLVNKTFKKEHQHVLCEGKMAI